jgi:hypothetical protein
MQLSVVVLGAALLNAVAALAGPLAGHRLLVASVRTGDTEIFVADPTRAT